MVIFELILGLIEVLTEALPFIFSRNKDKK